MPFLEPLLDYFRVPLSTIEVAILGTAFVVCALGVPAVIAAVRLPRRMDIQPVAPELLSPRQRSWFDGIEARLRTEGYREALTFTVPNLPSENLNRAYISDGYPAMGMATIVKSQEGDVVTAASYVEFVTEFADGTGVTTRSAAQDDLFDPLPGSEIHVHRYVKDPSDLKRHHDAHCQPFLVKGPVFHSHDEFASVLRGYHERWIAQQAQQGLIQEAADGQFRPTIRLAMRGIRNFFNPFEETVNLWKFAAVLLGGISVPMLANLAVLDARVPIVAGIDQLLGAGTPVALALAMAPVMLAAGAFVGWTLPNNTFVWPCVCAWLGSRLFLGEVAGDWIAQGIWLSALLAVPVAATRASTLRHRWLGLL